MGERCRRCFCDVMSGRSGDGEEIHNVMMSYVVCEDDSKSSALPPAAVSRLQVSLQL